MELMVVVAISGILMAAAVPTFLGARNRANANACTANLEIINSALKEWSLDNPDAALAVNDTVTVGDIDAYVDSGVASLDEPDGGSYVTDTDGSGTVTAADVVVTIVTVGQIPDPTCSEGGDHTL